MSKNRKENIPTQTYTLRSQANRTREELRSSESDALESNKTTNISEVEMQKANMGETSENINKTKMPINELVRLLSLQVKNEYDQNNKTIITVDTFAKILSDFDGENVPVEKWFTNFEQNADAYELNDKQ